jgi:ubiquinone/menaquinone biosynthesis C-methylase UbiE
MSVEPQCSCYDSTVQAPTTLVTLNHVNRCWTLYIEKKTGYYSCMSAFLTERSDSVRPERRTHTKVLSTMSVILTDTATQRERAYFDQFVASEGEFNPFTQHGWQTLARQFEQAVQPQEGFRILDVGCGTGQSRKLYTPRARHYLGIDLSERAIAAARARYPESDWLAADARALPFATGSFDVVAFSSVLHHIPDFPVALREAVRVLRPGGQVFAFDPNLLHPAMALFRHPRSPLYLPQGVSPDERPLQPWYLRQAFQKVGLGAVRQRCLSDIPYRAVAPRLLNACLAFYNVADRLWAWSGLGHFFGTFVITWGCKPAAVTK